MSGLSAGLPRRRAALLLSRWRRSWPPWFVNDYLLTVLVLILYFAYAGQAWNVMMGFAGQLSLGRALYVGLSSYVAAMLFTRLGVGPWLVLLATIPLAAACGAVIGYLAFRFRVAGVYFAILTIAFAEFARIGFDNWGFVNARAACSCRSSNMSTTTCGCCARAGDVLLCDPRCDCARLRARHFLVHSRIGYFWLAIREDEEARAPSASTPSATRCTR
jgi:branched-chain amino acid transport system permease protein